MRQGGYSGSKDASEMGPPARTPSASAAQTRPGAPIPLTTALTHDERVRYFALLRAAYAQTWTEDETDRWGALPQNWSDESIRVRMAFLDEVNANRAAGGTQ